MKFARIVAASAILLLLNSCFLQPGKFTSAMTILRDGSFTFAYTGEIHLFSYKKMMEEMGGRDSYDMGEFDAENTRCWAEDMATDAAANAAPAVEATTDGAADAVAAAQETVDAIASGDRECTKEELADKKKDWDEERAAQQQRNAEKKKEMAEMFGGLDPNDPKTLDEFARRLQGQEGWKKVTHRGDGVFDVDYEIAGRLDHDFVFPVYPGQKYIIPFVEVTKRKDGRVGIMAPAFVGAGNENGAGANMFAAAMMGARSGMGGAVMPEGTFTIRTDAEILTNNTQDGPTSDGGMKMLSWLVSPLDSKMPEALLKL